MFSALKNKDSAVSSLTSVILIVVLTVGMTAIFAFGAMSMSENLVSGKVVAVTAEPYSNSDDRGITLTVWGGKDIGSLVSIQAIVGDYKLLIKGTEGDTITNPVVGGKYDFGVTVGNIIITDGEGRKLVTTENLDESIIQNAEVDFVGTFTDGTRQIIYTSKMTIAGTGSSGSFDNGIIKVSAYSYPDYEYYGGHGLSIIPYEGVSISPILGNTILSYSFKDEDGFSHTSDLFTGLKPLPEGGYIAIIKPDASNMPYGEKGKNGILVGDVEIKAKKPDGGDQTDTFKDIKIPARINVINGPEYTGNVVSSLRTDSSRGDYTSVNITFNDALQLGASSSVISYIKKPDGTVNILRKNLSIRPIDNPSYHTSDGHAYGFYKDLGSSEYSDNDEIEIYFYTLQNEKSYVWHLVAEITVGDLRNMWLST